MFDSYIWQVHLFIRVYTDHVYFSDSLSKLKRGETSSELSFRPYYALNFCTGTALNCSKIALNFGTARWLLCLIIVKAAWQPLIVINFRSAHAGRSCAYT